MFGSTRVVAKMQLLVDGRLRGGGQHYDTSSMVSLSELHSSGG